MTPDTHPDLFRVLESIAASLKTIAAAAQGNAPRAAASKPVAATPSHNGDTSQWRSYTLKGGKLAGKTLGELADAYDRDGVTTRLQWWIENYQPRLRNDGTPWPDNLELRAMLDQAARELTGQPSAPRAVPTLVEPAQEENVPF
jgi:hypothetical protein